jgi:hypothetical protein
LRGKNRSGEEKERKWRLARGMWVWFGRELEEVGGKVELLCLGCLGMAGRGKV